MFLLISPAKTLDETPSVNKKYTTPNLLEESTLLAKVLKTKTSVQIQKLMNVSEKIADLNTERYQSFEPPFSLDNAKQALLTFKGDVYQGLNAESFDARDLNYAQKKIRILSGLYGILKPLDLIQPYRLEMGIRLKTKKAKNLYEFWGDKIVDSLNEEITSTKNKYVINLASKEYFKAINTEKLNGQLFHIHFKEKRQGQFKIISFSAKKARGMMCHYVVKNRLTRPTQLKQFDYEDYQYNEELSDANSFVFTR